jgi:hypothetical protein
MPVVLRSRACLIPALLLFALPSVAITLWRQTPRAEPDRCLRRSVQVSITDGAGKQVPGLQPSNFRAKYRGHAAQIISVNAVHASPRVLLVLDASGSMISTEGSRSPKWEFALAAAATSVKELPATSSVGLIVFKGPFELKINFTQERQGILHRLELLREGEKALPKGPGRTPLWDEILAGLAMFGAPEPGDAIVAITDGGDNSSSNRPEKVERALLAAGVRLFALLPPIAPGGLRSTPEEQGGPVDMQHRAETTGGDFMWLQNLDPGSVSLGRFPEFRNLRAALQFMCSRISESYRIDLELQEPVDKPRGWKLELVNVRPPHGQEFWMAYPHELMPCTDAAGGARVAPR